MEFKEIISEMYDIEIAEEAIEKISEEENKNEDTGNQPSTSTARYYL